ncbi:MAG TPA: hypothetical protein VG122_20555 [Gemmata sp.]|jgi:hypothetical protein|nr:hypothetical protein [Gemmata sp.]
MLRGRRLRRADGRVAQWQNHLGRGDDRLDPFHEGPHEFAQDFGSIVGSGRHAKLDAKLLIDERTYGYARPLGSQRAGHGQKCDADIFRNQLKGFLGRQHILIVLMRDTFLFRAPQNHVVQYGMYLTIKNNPCAVAQLF